MFTSISKSAQRRSTHHQTARHYSRDLEDVLDLFDPETRAALIRCARLATEGTTTERKVAEKALAEILREAGVLSVRNEVDAA